MKTVSLVINVDTRKNFLNPTSAASTIQGGEETMGTRSVDYLTDGVENKIKAFAGFDVEVIVYCDTTEPVPEEAVSWLMERQRNGTIAQVVFAKHVEHYEGNYFPFWNDINYCNALNLARGYFIAHVDGDTSVFMSSPAHLEHWLNRIERDEVQYVCYPSQWSPKPTEDPAFTYRWASTRFFLCKRSSFDFTEHFRCVRDTHYMWAKYGEQNPKCPWFEHVLGITANGEVWYPPRSDHDYLVFSWSRYRRGLQRELNQLNFDQVRNYVQSCGGIQYPCDVVGQ